MDKNQLVTIAVTTAVTVIIREVLTWLVAFVKSTATREVIRAKLRAIITKNKLTILADVFGLSYGVLWFRRMLHDQHSLTRWEIVLLILSTNYLLYWIVRLYTDVADTVVAWLKQRKNRPTQV
jgi:hypothetical protein